MFSGGGMRPPPPMYKGRPPPGMFGHHPSPSHTPMSSTSYPVPAPRSGTKMNKPTARYHPSLSGSETDVSTSTENLTQVSFFPSYIYTQIRLIISRSEVKISTTSQGSKNGKILQ